MRNKKFFELAEVRFSEFVVRFRISDQYKTIRSFTVYLDFYLQQRNLEIFQV